MPSWASSRAANPARTRAWSSASSTRIIAAPAAPGSSRLQRQPGPDREAAARPGPGGQLPAQRGGALGHAADPAAPAASAVARRARNPDPFGPVVLDLVNQGPAVRPDPDPHARGAGLPQHIGLRL